MDTTAAPSRPSDRRLLIIVALAAALVGVLAGRWSPSSSPAGAVVDAWHEPSFIGSGFAGADAAPYGYGIDGEGFVHLRGMVIATDVVVERANGTAGPWQIHAFTLPCGYRPETRLLVEVGVYDTNGTVGHEGVLQINDDGIALLGALDIPTVPDDDDQRASFITFLDTVTFQAEPDSPECIDEEPTTTTTTTEPETTTTTTEPEE